MIIVTFAAAILILGAFWAARSGRLTGRASKMLIVAVIAIAGIVLMFYPFLGFQEEVGG